MRNQVRHTSLNAGRSARSAHAARRPANSPARAPAATADRPAGAAARPPTARTRRAARSCRPARAGADTGRARGADPAPLSSTPTCPTTRPPTPWRRRGVRHASCGTARRRSLDRHWLAPARGCRDAATPPRAARPTSGAAWPRATRYGHRLTAVRRRPPPSPTCRPSGAAGKSARILAGLAGEQRARQAVRVAVGLELAGRDHARDRHAGRALRDAEQLPRPHEQLARQARRVDAEQGAGDHRSGRQRPSRAERFHADRRPQAGIDVPIT